jgi:PhnB protein
MVETRITPYLCVNDGNAAIEYYRQVFGATELMRVTADDGRIGHADLSINGAALMLSDEHPEINVLSPTTLGNAGLSLHIHVDDVDAVFARAVAAGGQAEREPKDEVYGERSGIVRDPFGHRRFIATPIEAVPFDEMRDRFAAEGYTTTGTP